MADPIIPMWIVKAKGESYYVHHVDCNVPWSTKETPENSHTKGSIKIKNCLLTIDEDNNATISVLTEEDKERLGKTKDPVILITRHGTLLKETLDQMNIQHGEIRRFGGGCSTLWSVVSVNTEQDLFALTLVIPEIRKLMPNEDYYRYYVNGVSEYAYDQEDYEDLYES